MLSLKNDKHNFIQRKDIPCHNHIHLKKVYIAHLVASKIPSWYKMVYIPHLVLDIEVTGYNKNSVL